MNTKLMVTNAAKDALTRASRTGNKQKDNGSRSYNFVIALAEEYRKAFSNRNPTVFCRKCDDNRLIFGVNELLFDITAVILKPVPSISGEHELSIITDCLVVVESEFEQNMRDILLDFSKLTLSNSQNKLFVATRMVSDTQIQILEEAASHCQGHLEIALLPHPDTWDNNPVKVEKVELLQFKNGVRI